LGGETAEEGGKEREGKRKNKEKKKKRRKETQVPCAAIPSIFWINDPNKEEPSSTRKPYNALHADWLVLTLTLGGKRQKNSTRRIAGNPISAYFPKTLSPLLRCLRVVEAVRQQVVIGSEA
jgi:hypothetical protein